MENSSQESREVYIVDGYRTPFLKARGKPGVFSASDLAVQAGRELLKRQPFNAKELGEVVIGCTMPSPDEANIARVIALRLGCGDAMPAYTVQRNCASGMQAIDSALKDIASGRHELALAGGTEAMSRAPLLFNDNMVNWFAGFMASKTFGAKLKQVAKFRPQFLSPVVALLRGLTDATVNLNMGQTAENLAYRFDISRESMDEFSFNSHKKVVAAKENNYFGDLTTAYSQNGKYFDFDDGVRADSSLEKLATLKPFFDKKFGKVTAGNSSQVTDGAALLLLASKEAVKKYKLPVLAKIVNVEWAALDPTEMGLGPVYASQKVLEKYNMRMGDIDFWEINEAFSAQVIACAKAFASEEYCKEFFGLDSAIGQLDMSRLNVDGGAIALGHPVGASGARIVLRLANILKREKAKRGLASICIGGGQGGAVLIENVSETGV